MSVPEVSPESTGLAKRVRQTITETTRDVCCEMFKQNVEAIVLTGSLARDEGTIVKSDQGWALLGDADFLLSFKEGAHRVSALELRNAESAIEGRLRSKSCTATVTVGSVSSRYFGKLPAYSYTYELKHCGHVICGDTKVLDRIPSYSAAQLSKEDAWRTLCNRLIELLTSDTFGGTNGDRAGQEVTYATTKLCLDMATSFLIFAGYYEPTYRGRERKLKTLAENSALEAPFDLRQFSELVSNCTEMKLSGGPFLGAELKIIGHIVERALKLWFWEIARLTGERTRTSIPCAVRLVARKLTLSQRCRAWGSFLRRANWIKEWRQWPRWIKLSWDSTPRYLVYELAAELASRFPLLLTPSANNRALDLTTLRSKLPDISSFPLHSSCTADMLISEIRRNYQQYLCETYA